ncbi:MAG TPA: hypothetical protein VMM78_13975, partial [Thermomicrobiales bacterium]|nr:hypothetical protein [Thermomicrobiales bacterium]
MVRSHIGDSQTSGFLPVTTGNVRKQSVVDLCREHLVFRELRDPSLPRLRVPRAVWRFALPRAGALRRLSRKRSGLHVRGAIALRLARRPLRDTALQKVESDLVEPVGLLAGR